MRYLGYLEDSWFHLATCIFKQQFSQDTLGQLLKHSYSSSSYGANYICTFCCVWHLTVFSSQERVWFICFKIISLYYLFCLLLLLLPSFLEENWWKRKKKQNKNSMPSENNIYIRTMNGNNNLIAFLSVIFCCPWHITANHQNNIIFHHLLLVSSVYSYFFFQVTSFTVPSFRIWLTWTNTGSVPWADD